MAALLHEERELMKWQRSADEWRHERGAVEGRDGGRFWETAADSSVVIRRIQGKRRVLLL